MCGMGSRHNPRRLKITASSWIPSLEANQIPILDPPGLAASLEWNEYRIQLPAQPIVFSDLMLLSIGRQYYLFSQLCLIIVPPFTTVFCLLFFSWSSIIWSTALDSNRPSAIQYWHETIVETTKDSSLEATDDRTWLDDDDEMMV